MIRDSSWGNTKIVVVKSYHYLRNTVDRMTSDSASESSRTPVIVIDGDDLPQDGGTGRYTIGGIETQLLNGTPASESGDPQPESPFIPDGSETNPLDKKK